MVPGLLVSEELHVLGRTCEELLSVCFKIGLVLLGLKKVGNNSSTYLLEIIGVCSCLLPLLVVAALHLLIKFQNLNAAR